MASSYERQMAAYKQRQKKKKEESEKSSSSSKTSASNTTEKTTSANSSNKSSSDAERDRQLAAYQQRKKEWTAKAKDVDANYINTFISDARKYVDTAKYDYDKADFKTSSSVYSSRYQTSRDLRERADKIRSYLKVNDVDNGDLYSFLDNFNSSVNTIQNEFKSKRNTFSKFDTEEDYNSYVSEMKKREDQGKLDTAAEQIKVDDLKKRYDNAQAIYNTIQSKWRGIADLETIPAYQEDMRYLQTALGEYKTIEDMKSDFTQKALYLNQAKRIQTAARMTNDATNAKDFDAYSAKGAAMVNPSFKDASYDFSWAGIKIGGEDVKNKARYTRENYDEFLRQTTGTAMRGSGNQEAMQDAHKINDLFLQMNDDELKIYDYYAAKDDENGTNLADEYYKSIEQELQNRKAYGIAKPIDGVAASLIFAASAGMDQFSTGIENLFKGEEDYITTNAMQVASQIVRENLADDGAKLPDWMGGSSLGQVGYDIVNTTANMLPSILVSTVAGSINPTLGAALGSATLGTSAAGNAYAEMLNLGYDKGQAKSYAALIGISEASLQYALGGISKLGGKLSGNAIKNVLNGVDNALARIAIQLGGNMLSEFTEEALQEILDPLIRNAVFSEENDIKWDEVLYSGILGALTATVMEGGGTISENVSHYTAGKAVQKVDGGVERLAKIGNTFAADTVAYQLAGRVNENTGAYTIGRLFNEVNATLTEQNQNDIAEALIKKGTPEEIARKNAKIIADIVDGAVPTEQQAKIIESNDVLAETLAEVLINPNTTVYQRSSTAFSLATEMAQQKQGKKATQETTGEETATSEGKPTEVVEPSQREYSVSTEGKTLDTEGNEVKIKEVESVTKVDGKNVITYKLDNGKTITNSDIMYASQEEALVTESMALVGASMRATQNVLKNFNPSDGISIETYADAAALAYSYGLTNDVVSVKKLAGMPLEKGMIAFYQGQHDAGVRIKEQTAKIRDKVRAAEAQAIAEGKPIDKKVGQVHYIGKKKIKATTERQKTAVKMVEYLAQLTGVDFYIYESYEKNGKTLYKDENGVERNAPNGKYKDGKIYLDINASNFDQKGILMGTTAHELTHHIERTAPAKFKVLANLLVQEYSKHASVEEAIQAIIADYAAEGKTLSREKAFSEFVANGMEDMLTNGNVIEFLQKVKQQDKTLWQKIVDFFKKFAQDLKRMVSAYEGFESDSEIASVVREMGEVQKQLEQLYAEALLESSENVQRIGGRNIEDFAAAQNTDGESLFQYRAMENDAKTYRTMLKKWGKLTDAEITTLFNTIDKAMDIIKDNLEVLDYAWEADINDRAFSPVKPNSDSLYQVSLDFSTLCRKRLLQQAVQGRLQEALNKPLTREEGIAIRDALIALQEEGRQIEVACALCYVESARMKSPAQIQKFIKNRESVLKDFFASKNGGDIKAKIQQAETAARARLGVGDASLKSMPKKVADQIRAAKKEAKASYVPTAEEQKLIDIAKGMTVADFTSPEGLENLAKNYRDLFDAYTSYIRNATKSKGIENDTWWRAGDSASISDTLIANMNRENGLRSQSWSDFQVIHLLDYIAATIELSTRNAKEQAYTKVPDFVELMGNTGVMINLSLIPTRDFNGNLEYDSTEGMAYEVAKRLRDKYHATAGTICIGVDNAQIKLLLGDATIDYVIPYHRSGMAKHIRKAMHIPTWSEYEQYQSESNLSDAEAAAQAKKYGVKLLPKSDKNYQKHTSFSEWFDLKEAQQIAKMENANPSNKNLQKQYGVMYGGYMAMQNAANNYLKLCAERGLAPKFSHEKADFTGEANYWKLLIDRKMVDNVTGEIIEQQSIKPVFDEGEILRILNDELERYPKVKADQEYAERKVTEKFLSGEIKEGMSAKAIADVMKTPVDNIATANILASAEDVMREHNEELANLYQNAKENDSILSMISKVLTGNFDRKEKLYLGVVSENNAKQIKELIGIDVAGFKVAIEARQIEHILLRHGKNGKADKSMSNPSDIAKLEYALNTPDDVSEAGRTNAYYNMVNGRNKTAKTVLYEKEIGEKSYYVVQAVPDTKAKTLFIVSAFIGEKGYKKETPQLINAKSPDATAKTVAENVSNKNVAQPDSGVNTSEDEAWQLRRTTKPDTFYSLMGKAVEGIKSEKVGAGGVVSYLKGRGVKNEEIKWSGIEAFLEGKKSVTKKELQEFVAGSMIQIEESTIDYTETPMTEERKKRIASLEKDRDVIVDKLKAEWKKIVGTDLPIQNYGAGLDSAVEEKIRDINLEQKKASFEGRLVEKLRKDLRIVIENNDDFGFDSWKDALRSIHRHRRSFIDSYEMSTNDKAVIVKYCNALNAYNELPNKISDADTKTLRDIAYEANKFNNDIGRVKLEHYNDEKMPRWGSYKLDGGKNYREIVFRMPDSNYTNDAMYVHWGEPFGMKGVLAHARVQDFEQEFNGWKTLFIEEIQSDWHNAGANARKTEKAIAEHNKKKAKYDSIVDGLVANGVVKSEYDLWEALRFGLPSRSEKIKAALGDQVSFMDEYLREEAALENQPQESVPDAPFSGNYHEFVLKRLIREAAENGYDSIAWTTAAMQSERWSDQYAEGYRIEYDQDIPKFLNKYGKKWGARVEKVDQSVMGGTSFEQQVDDAFIDDMLTDTDRNSRMVWSMDITDSMRESVMTEGQPLFQERDKGGMSKRNLLANALETAAQNDIEKHRLAEYKSKISMLDAEEAKLHDLNEQIKELSFAKGTKDTKKIKDLQFERNQTANRITTLDKSLLTLEASKPLQDVLQREKQKAYKRAEQKGKEALAKYREKAAETQREIITRYQESKKRGIEGRKMTEMRGKIKSVVNELNNLLLHGSKDKHVMVGLQKVVAEALDIINMDTVNADARVAKYNALIAQAKDPDVIKSLTETRDRIQGYGDKFSEKMDKLKAAYANIKNSEDPLVANAYDEVIAQRIESVSAIVGNTSLREMSLEQLGEVYDMYKMVLTVVRNSNKAFKAKKNESISVLANRTMEEIHKVGGTKQLALKALQGLKAFSWNNLKPIYALSAIGSDTLTEAFSNVRAGEDTWAVDVNEAKDFFDSISKKYGYKDWDFKKRYSFKSTTGVDFELSLEQILSLYAYSKREQADKHLEKGGFVFDSSIETHKEIVRNGKKRESILKYTVNTATAHNLSKEGLAKIIGTLSEDQKMFVDIMQGYLSDVMGAKGNEVSLEMYGVKLFNEMNYFPLKSAKQYMFEQNETAGEVKIKNSGFSKETVVNASNPIILSNFMDVWANHVNDMSMYHAFVLSLEDFNRIFNYKTPTSEKMNSESVKAYMQNAYGAQSVEYISQLLKDLNGGVRSNPRESTGKKLISRFKKSAVMASASVVVQQPSAVARALALIDAKYFDFNPKIIQHKKLWNEVKKYAPVAIIKEMGRFDTDMGRSTVDYIKSEATFMEKVDDVLSKPAAYADELTWCHIWTAVKREVLAKKKANNEKVETNSDAFLKAVGERFTEVIVKTQVYDSVLARSANMRDKGVFMNMVTSFMAEPTTSINMVTDAIRQGKRGNKAYARKAVGAVYASLILNAALSSIVYAMRDDDDDETMLEKYVGSFTTEVIDSFNPLTYLPFVKDAWSIAQGYDVERSDMSLVSDAVGAFQNIVKLVETDTDGMDDEELAAYNEKLRDAILSGVDGIASLLGIPEKNLRRDITAAFNTYKTFTNGLEEDATSMWEQVIDAAKNSTPIWGWMKDEAKEDKLYDAIINGDATYRKRIESQYDDQTAVDNAIRKALRSNDPRIKQAAEAYYNGNIAEYTRIAKAVIADGFKQDNVVKAIMTEVNGLKPDKDTDTTSKATGLYKTEAFIQAIMSGDQATADLVRRDLIDTMVTNGKTEEDATESFESSVRSDCREQFIEGNLTETEAIDVLVNYCGNDTEYAEKKVGEWQFEVDYGFSWSDRGDAYKNGEISASELKTILVDVGGKTAEEADLQVQIYDWQKEVPNCDDITASAIKDYNEFCESAGISKDVYYNAWSDYNDTPADYDENGDSIPYSKTKKVMPIINALPISSEQKTALALCWWGEKTVRKYRLW